ncbi:ankyrin repeat-containing protein [Desulfosarcina variabilis str. Montpellier]
MNAQADNGTTALIYAAHYNFFDMAKVLLKYNADTTLKDKYGNTAYDYASSYEYTRLIDLLGNQ